MKTRIIKIDPKNIDRGLLGEAAKVLTEGGLVAFPTETVYGLGANALDPEAVAKIFEAKKRPLDDPLIVHISREEEVHELAVNIDPAAEKLMELFWPGPLTLILEKKDKVPDIVSTGLDTVAIRMPSCPVAGELLKIAGVPVAAPSANLFGRPSPTTADHVVDDLEGIIDVVLDGGKTEIGVESTVVQFAGGEARILRPGGISVEDITAVIENVRVYTEEEILKSSPGKYEQHYSPKAKVVLIKDDPMQVEKCLTLAGEASNMYRVGILAKAEHAEFYKGLNAKVIGPSGDLTACAGELFHVLREFDKDGVEVIFAESFSENGIGLAIMNRLRKAAG